jgi:hypothetical protein
MLDPYGGLLVKGPVGTTDRRKKSAKGDDLHNRKERLLGVGLHCCRVHTAAATCLPKRRLHTVISMTVK